MFDMKCIAFLCISLTVLGANAGAVSFIDPCHWKDSECIKKSAEKAQPYIVNGVPELNVPSLSPLSMNNINGDIGELKLFFKNITVDTLSQCKIILIERSEKLKLDIELICPITAKGHYTVGGKLFLLLIDGDGPFELHTEAIKIAVSIILKQIEKSGEKHYKISSFDFKYEALKKVFFNFENLFGGDKKKAEPVISILDQSWKEIMDVLGKPVVQEIITQVVKGIGEVFLSIPSNKLELDD